MFTETIAKVCRKNPDCLLKDQDQDRGTPICPECGGELTPRTRTKKHLVAAVALIAIVLSASGSVLGYGLVVQQFTMAQTTRWLTGRLKVMDRVAIPDDRMNWFTGQVIWEFASGRKPDGFSDHFLCERRGEEFWFEPRFTASTGDKIHFELRPQAARHLYMFYRDEQNSRALYSGQENAGDSLIRVPSAEDLRLAGGSATETFVIVAAKKPVSQLAGLQSEGLTSGALDTAISAAGEDPDNLVMYVQIPHQAN